MYIRLNEVLKLTTLSRSSIYRYISEGGFPKQIKIGKRTVVWKRSEVESWLASKA
ncbi:MAG: AlpA family transcriptional regulator [Kangiella sp.]|nr:AlpA family transcriptional regulator [Kangiella sp.]